VVVTACTQPEGASADIVIKVSDTGCGMNEQQLARVYDPFYTTKDIGEGTGPGLATCYHSIRTMGGTLEISSNPGEGTEVIIALPTE